MNELVEHLATSLVGVKDGVSLRPVAIPLKLCENYRHFLSLSNGGYTPDNFFHFFGTDGVLGHNVFLWNDVNQWKHYYRLNDDSYIFCEDIFGSQYAFDIRGNRRVVKVLVPDGGRIRLCANTFEEFLRDIVMDDALNRELRELARSFFDYSGETFRAFSHITCILPSSIGGNDRDLSNLVLVDSAANMSILGQLTDALRDVPPGTRFRDVRIDYARNVITLVRD
jgi:hypothetical protein